MAGLLGMDDETLAIIGGLLSRGAIGRGINGYLEQKQRTQDKNYLNEYRQSQIDAQKAIREKADRESAAATQAAVQAAADREHLTNNVFSPYAAMGPGGPTPQNLTAFQNSTKPDSRVNQYQQAVAYFASRGDVANAEKFSKLAKGVRDSQEEYGLDPKEGLDPNGNPIQYRLGKYGSNETLPTTPLPKNQIVDRGRTKDVVDLLRAPAGTQFSVTQDPNSAAATALGWARLNYEKERAASPDGKWSYDPERGVAVNPTTGQSRPITGPDGPLGPKKHNAPEAFLKQSAGIQNLNTAVDEYVSALSGWSNKSLASPQALADMGTKYNNMMLQAKEAYNLGVLNGPDYMILTQTVTNPVSMKGAFTSNDALAGQAKALRDIMKKNQANLARVYGQPVPSAGAGGGWSITEVK